MTSYLLRRLLLVIPTLFGIIAINFVVVQFAPGGPLEQMISDHSGRSVEEVSRDIERDKILTADGAVEYGLIDAVLQSLKGTPALNAS